MQTNKHFIKRSGQEEPFSTGIKEGRFLVKKDAVIFDIDGTISDDSHRQPYLTNNSNITPELWEKYHSGCVDDKPFNIVCKIMQQLWKDHELILITGRDIKYKNETLSWLCEHYLKFDQLHMRPDGHHVSSVEFKTQIYKEHIEPKYNVLCVFEDRKCVVDMWRQFGLICLQTKEGNY